MTLPDFRSRFIEGSDNSSVIAPGLPNITGGAGVTDKNNFNGAFYKGSGFDSCGNTFSSGNYINFNASYSSSVYGASTTVQPPAITLIPQIKY